MPNGLTFTSYDALGSFDANTLGNYKFAIIKCNFSSIPSGSSLPDSKGVLIHFECIGVGCQLFISNIGVMYERAKFVTWNTWKTVTTT